MCLCQQLTEEFCFALCVSIRVCMIVYLKVCEHDILKTACDNFTKFTTSVHLGTKMNFLDFEVKRSKDQYHV